MSEVPLRLALEPMLPPRASGRGDTTLGRGYRLRLPDGPALLDDDPLLGAFGAEVDWVTIEDHEALQNDAFDPGRRLRLAGEPLNPNGHDEAAVRDADDIREVGTACDDAGARACAALDHGLPMAAVALWEERALIDDRRCRLKVLVYSPSLVRVQDAPPLPPHAPRSARRRVVLYAGRDGDLRWWDAAASGGPVDIDSLPVSDELAEAFTSLRADYQTLERQAVVGGDEGFDRLEESWTREALESEARRLWMRARDELGRGFVVGFLASGTSTPVWDPAEAGDEDGDLPY